MTEGRVEALIATARPNTSLIDSSHLSCCWATSTFWPVGFGHSRTVEQLLVHFLHQKVFYDQASWFVWLLSLTNTHFHWLYSEVSPLYSGHSELSLLLFLTFHYLSPNVWSWSHTKNANSPRPLKPFVPIRCANCKRKSLQKANFCFLLANSFPNVRILSFVAFMLSVHFPSHHSYQFYTLTLLPFSNPISVELFCDLSLSWTSNWMNIPSCSLFWLFFLLSISGFLLFPSPLFLLPQESCCNKIVTVEGKQNWQ